MLMKAICCLLLLGSGLQNPSIGDLGFLSGEWVAESGSTVTEELWSEPRAGTMFGFARTIAGDKTVFFEFVRIETRDGVLHYIAQPRGGAATAFKLTRFDGRAATFENPEHDFPKKIEYERISEDALRATISGVDAPGAKSQSWEFRRIR
ncbi:MAG: DUF6265 family protein [Phycisphaerales bacterium]|nr:DUF6265 family protein [Phycisphaerales bacterium]